MPRATFHGKLNPLNFAQKLQFLACTVEVRTDVAAFARRLRYLAQHAEQDHIVTGHADFEVTHEDGAYLVREDGALVFTDASGETAFEALFERIQRRAFAALPDDIRIHAASGVIDGKMFLLVGPPCRVKAVFYLDPEFSGKSRIYQCAKVDMVRHVMGQCSPPLSQRKGWIGDLCALINDATVHILTVGDLDSAALVIRDRLR